MRLFGRTPPPPRPVPIPVPSDEHDWWQRDYRRRVERGADLERAIGREDGLTRMLRDLERRGEGGHD
jgi:hypothetical protein